MSGVAVKPRPVITLAAAEVVAGVPAASLLLLVASGAGAAEQTREAPKEALGGGFEGTVSGQVATESGEPGTGTPAARRDGRFTAFTDVSDLAGITATHTAQRSNVHETRIGHPGQEVDRVANYLVTGQAWGDYDGDGRVDLYVTNQQGPNTLYHNEGDGAFSDSKLSEDVGLPGDVSGGAVFADYDNTIEDVSAEFSVAGEVK